MDFSVSEFRSTLSFVADMYKKGANQEAEAKLLEIREEFLRLREENLELKTMLLEAKEAMSVKASMQFEEPFYYLVEGDTKDGPFCQRCFDADGTQMRLIKIDAYHGSHNCPECKTSYGKGKPRPPIRMPDPLSRF